MTVPPPRSGPGKPLDAGVLQPGIGSFRLHLAAEGKAARTCGPAPSRCIPASGQAPGERPGPDQRPDHRGPEQVHATSCLAARLRRSPEYAGVRHGDVIAGRNRPVNGAGARLDHRRGMQQGPVAAPAARPSRTCGRACARGRLGLVVTDAGRPGPDRVPVPQVASLLTVPRRGSAPPNTATAAGRSQSRLARARSSWRGALPCLLARIPRSHPEHRGGDGQQLLAVPLQEPVGVAVPSSGADRRAQHDQIPVTDRPAHAACWPQVRLDALRPEGLRDRLGHLPGRSVFSRVGHKDTRHDQSSFHQPRTRRFHAAPKGHGPAGALVPAQALRGGRALYRAGEGMDCVPMRA